MLLNSDSFDLSFPNDLRTLKKHKRTDRQTIPVGELLEISYSITVIARKENWVCILRGAGVGAAQELPPTNCTMQGGPEVILGYRVLLVGRVVGQYGVRCCFVVAANSIYKWRLLFLYMK